ncbi:MAG: alpha/beta fold hydrolase [Halioglobus sp.]
MPHAVLVLVFCLLPLLAQGEDATPHKVESNGHILTVWEKSPAKPRAQILLLHGRTWSSIPDFDLQVEGEDLSFMDGLVALGYRVYALDGRGYGATPRDPSGWLTPTKAAKDALAVMSWILSRDPLPLHLYGWSYGSMVGQLALQHQPTAAASLILFGYPWHPGAYSAPDHYPDKPPMKTNTAEAAASDFITPGSISAAAIDTYVTASLKADPIRVDFRDLHEWQELDASKVLTPTLLIKGQFDPLAPMNQQAEFFANLGTADKWFVELSGGDHAALLETPRNRMLLTMDSFIRYLDE